MNSRDERVRKKIDACDWQILYNKRNWLNQANHKRAHFLIVLQQSITKFQINKIKTYHL